MKKLAKEHTKRRPSCACRTHRARLRAGGAHEATHFLMRPWRCRIALKARRVWKDDIAYGVNSKVLVSRPFPLISSVKRVALLLLSFVSLVLAFGLCGCSDTTQKASESSDKDGLTKITFALDWTPNTNHIGLYVAQALGYYEDAGLQVEFVQPPDDGADALVASGKAEVGMSFQDIMAGYLGSDDPLPVTAVAAVVQHNTSGIMSRKGEGITSAKGLEGKRYGTWDIEIEKAIIQSIVGQDGADYNKVKLVPANSTDEVAGLKDNQFDAVWVFEGWALQNAKVKGYPVDYFSIRESDNTFDYYTPVIIANDAFAKDHPEELTAFLTATAKGYGYAAEHPKEAAKLLMEAVPELDPALTEASAEYLADKFIDDAPAWGYIDPARWDAFYQWLNNDKLVSIPIKEGAGFTNEYLPGGAQ